MDAKKVGRKPDSWGFEDAASLPYVSFSLFSSFGADGELLCRVTFVTAVAALTALGISLPFLPGCQPGSFQP